MDFDEIRCIHGQLWSVFGFIALTKDIGSIIGHGGAVFFKDLSWKLGIIRWLGFFMERHLVLIVWRFKVLFVLGLFVGFFARFSENKY